MEFENIRPREIGNYELKFNSLIIDLRSHNEYMQGHIPTAVNIPYDELDFCKYKLKRYYEIILYCERGGNSLLAARMLSRLGYRIKNVYGGFSAYRGEISLQENFLID